MLDIGSRIGYSVEDEINQSGAGQANQTSPTDHRPERGSQYGNRQGTGPGTTAPRPKTPRAAPVDPRNGEAKTATRVAAAP
jgi:hypothetical protein